MPPESQTSQLRQRKQRPEIFLPFNRARKKTLLLWPRTVAGVDCVRLLMSLQTLIKNVQELAKEEGEGSEAKLREAIEILEGATFATTSSWQDFWRTIFQEYRYQLLDKSTLQGSLSKWEPIRALPPFPLSHRQYRPYWLDCCWNEAANLPFPSAFSLYSQL